MGAGPIGRLSEGGGGSCGAEVARPRVVRATGQGGGEGGKGHLIVRHVDEELGVLEERLEPLIGVVDDDGQLLQRGVRRDGVELPLQHAQRLELHLLQLLLGVLVVRDLAQVVETRHLDLGELGGDERARDREELNAVLVEPPLLDLREEPIKVAHGEARRLRLEPKVLADLGRGGDEGVRGWGPRGQGRRVGGCAVPALWRTSLMNCTTDSR